jgi:hypothetical protein
MKTSDHIAIRYFDTLTKKLEELAVNVDEDCPVEYRTEHLKEAVASSFDLIAEIAHVQMIDNERTDQPGKEPNISF